MTLQRDTLTRAGSYTRRNGGNALDSTRSEPGSAPSGEHPLIFDPPDCYFDDLAHAAVSGDAAAREGTALSLALLPLGAVPFALNRATFGLHLAIATLAGLAVMALLFYIDARVTARRIERELEEDVLL